MSFGKKLRKLRKERGISQQELAKKLGCKSNSYIYDIEKGNFIPSEKKIKRLAKALRVPLSKIKDIIFESKIENFGIKDMDFINMFRDYPNLSKKDREGIVRFYNRIKSRNGTK